MTWGGRAPSVSLRDPIRHRMPKLTPAIQRLILAFTTGLFLACAAGVSAQRVTPIESFAE